MVSRNICFGVSFCRLKPPALDLPGSQSTATEAARGPHADDGRLLTSRGPEFGNSHLSTGDADTF